MTKLLSCFRLKNYLLHDFTGFWGKNSRYKYCLNKMTVVLKTYSLNSVCCGIRQWKKAEGGAKWKNYCLALSFCWLQVFCLSRQWQTYKLVSALAFHHPFHLEHHLNLWWCPVDQIMFTWSRAQWVFIFMEDTGIASMGDTGLGLSLLMIPGFLSR